MSKMGISTYQSYCGAQIFDAVGLSSAFIDKYFTGTATTIEGVGLAQVAEETVRRHRSRLWRQSDLPQHARRRRHVRPAPARRGTRLDCGQHRQPAARGARQRA
jgi:glutamate synthase domain-containing protein 2